MGVRHANVMAEPDDPGAETGSDEWNADHVPGDFPTRVETVNFATGSSATPTITIGTPNVGDVIFVAAGNVQYPLVSVSGAGVSNWIRVRQSHIQANSYALMDLFMGVVDGTPGTTISLTFQGTNTYYIAAQVYRGLQGIVVATGAFSAYFFEDQCDPYIPPMAAADAPLGIAAYFARGQGSPTSAGITDLTTQSAGGDRAILGDVDLSDGVSMMAARWTGSSYSQNQVAVGALIR